MSAHESSRDPYFAGEVRPPRKFSWYGLAIVVLAPTLIVGLLLPALQSPRHRNLRRFHCASNLRQVGLALLAYHNAHGCFPPPYIADSAGKPMHSWRTLVLPFLDNQDLFNEYRFDEPWDGPINGRFADVRIGLYRCPMRLDVRLGLTEYVLIRGPGTAFPGDRRVSLAQVRDDPSTTILAVEMVDSGIHWAEPRDLDIGQMSFRINDPSRPGLSSYHSGGVNVLMMDGSVRFLRDDLSPATLKALLTIDGGEIINKDDLSP